jgi:HEPN domain-containing protein
MSLLGFRSKVYQLIKARSAPSNVTEQAGELSVRGLLRELEQDFAPRTVDALRIGKVIMHHPVKRVEQFFFQIHSARPGQTWSPRLPCCPEQNPTIYDRCR